MWCYGLNFPNLGAGSGLVGVRALNWHEVTFEQRTGTCDRFQPTGLMCSEGRATLHVSGAMDVHVLRDPRLSVDIVSARRLGEAEIVHPVLAFAGAAAAYWTNRVALHAAAAVLNGTGWLLLGRPGGGKSTLAACLSRRGHAVLCDDLAVLDGRTVLAGPRSADLRADAAEELALGFLLQTATGRRRWRTGLGAAPFEVPLGGLFSLEWGEFTSVRKAGLSERLQLLAGCDALNWGPPTPTALLDLLDVPLYVLRRPRTWDGLEATLDSIERLAGGSVSGEPCVLQQHHRGEGRTSGGPLGGQAVDVDERSDIG